MEEKNTTLLTEKEEARKASSPFSADVYKSSDKNYARSVLFAKQSELEAKSTDKIDTWQNSAKEFLSSHKNFKESNTLNENSTNLDEKTKEFSENIERKEVVTSKAMENFNLQEDPPEIEKKFEKKKKNFRFKLFTAVASLILTICAGWVVYNSVEISKTNYQIAQYLIKIEQLDGATQVNNGGENFVTSVVEVEPRALTEPTEIQIQTNFFDKLCNFFSKIFGG